MEMSGDTLKSGQIIPLRYANRDLKAIIIDPNGLGSGKPSIGLGFRGMDRLIGIRQQTLTDRVTEIQGDKYLKLPSGATFRVTEILAEDGNTSQYRDKSCRAWLKSACRREKSEKVRRRKSHP